MPRPEKVQAVAEIKERWEEADAVFVTEFRGMTVKQLQSLRRGLRAIGADYKVFKMSLTRRATDELGIEGLEEHLVGPSALTFAGSDPVAAAKTLKDAGRDNEHLVVKAGVLRGGVVILPEQVSALAEIEPREVLLAKIAGAAKSPLQSMAGMLGSFTRNAATMFSQLMDKKAESGEATAAGPVGEQASGGDEPSEAVEPAPSAPADEAAPEEEAAPADEAPEEQAAPEEAEPADAAEEE